MARRKRRETSRSPRRWPRIAVAVSLLALALAIQTVLFRQAAPVELPNEEERGPIQARRGVDALVVDLPPGTMWRSAPDGSRLTGVDLDKGLLDDATRELLNELPTPPPKGETSVSYRPLPPDVPSDGTAAENDSATHTPAASVVECSTSWTWTVDEASRLELTQDGSSSGCDIEWRASRESRLRLVGISDAEDHPGCRRRLRLDAFATRVRDPLSVEWTIPAETSVRLQFAPTDDDSVCVPFDLASLRFERVAARTIDQASVDADTSASRELWTRHADAPTFTTQAFEIDGSAISLAIRGEGWVVRRGKLSTRNRLSALSEFEPLARIVSVVVDLGLLGWIASLVLGKDEKD